ncbi:YobI family P-loop NTPase [Pseudomonas donghuensis]|uniref:YobI family P-loop NTPase n=1 Tax=Pseudomonas donghuensis TaxID=1163398 RepID=UPI00215E9C02|nr:hypothetical protein [Pseudomonas donghuensis]UVL27160.1 hypothetical protein LOY32_13045 [Pseudomonas donghuensis]
MVEHWKRQLERLWTALDVGIRQAIKAYHRPPPPKSDETFFEPLTPVRLNEEISGRYERELRRALENPDILNIAVTGSYGAGKSSVLKTFFENHPYYKHTYVSLATFTKTDPVGAPGPKEKSDAPSEAPTATGAAASEPKADKDKEAKGEKADKDSLINRIEETIVQQLLYAVQARKVPKTRLKRITQISNLHLWRRTGAMAALAVCALRLYSPTIANNSGVASSWLLEKLLLISEPWALAGLAAGGVWLLYTALKFLSLFSIDGLTLKGGKLEAVQHGSVLHKNVDEIIYCFERSDVDVVVIEDLDRFDVQEIFFRLREINFIIRNSPQVKRPVRFVYAIRDEMFGVGDKTKFFDLIIPIIPVVHGDNANELLSKLLGKDRISSNRLPHRLHERLIDNVGYYIDDMRLIKNLVNEYSIYESLLVSAGVNLDLNKLFAMVAIRNLYPGAFADLVKRRGKLYSIFEEYPAWVTIQIKSTEDALAASTERRTARQHDYAIDLIDLRTRVWYETLKRGGEWSVNSIMLKDGGSLTLNDIVQDDGIARFQASQIAYPLQQPNSVSQGGMQRPEVILKEMNYEARAKVLSDSLTKLDAEVDRLERELRNLKAIPFRVAVKKAYGEIVREKLTDFKMVIFLVLKGYLETDYADYLGYFYEGSLTQADKNLILALGRDELLEIRTQVEKPERVVRALDHESLSQGRGILVNLINELLKPRLLEREEREERAEKLAVILKGGHEESERLGEAVEIFVDAEKGNELVQALHRADDQLILKVLSGQRFTTDGARARWLYHVLDTLTAEEVAKLDEEGILSTWVEELEDVSAWIPRMSASENGWQWLRSKPVQFSNISKEISPDDLKAVVTWRCLKLDLRMLRLLCQVADGNVEDDAVSYERLVQLDVPNLKEQLDVDIVAVVEQLMQQEGMLDESSDTLRALLELLSTQPDKMRALFSRTQCSLRGLEEPLREVWLLAMADDRIDLQGMPRAVWTVFSEVLNGGEGASAEDEVGNAEAVFLDYIQQNAEELAHELWNQSDQQIQLQRYLLCNERVEAETLASLLAAIKIDLSILDSSIPASRWAYISEAECVPYSRIGLDIFRSHAPHLELAYLLKRWEAAKHMLDFTGIPIDLTIGLSKSGVPSMEEVLQLWSVVPAEVFASNSETAVELAKACERASKEGARFPDSYLPVLFELTKSPFLSLGNRANIMIHLLNMNCDWLSVAAVLPHLGDEFAALAGQRRAIRLPAEVENVRLIEALQRRGFVRAKIINTLIFACRKKSTYSVERSASQPQAGWL